MKPSRWVKLHPVVVAMSLVLCVLFGIDIYRFVWHKAGFFSLLHIADTASLGNQLAYYLVCASLLFACIMFARHTIKPIFITGIRPRWAFFIPAGAALLVVVLFRLLWDQADTNDLPFVIATVFGLASVLGLAMSGIVLVNIHKAITGEDQLVKEAVTLLENTKNSLTFIALSPNLGYAAAIKTEGGGRIKVLHQALCGALQTLGKHQDAKTNVKMAFLNARDIRSFYDAKAASLRGLTGLAAEDGEQAYLQHSAGLQKEVEEKFNTYESARFTLKKFRTCLASSNQGGVYKVKVGELKNFPPLGMLIADGEKAILLDNVSMLTSEANALSGYMANSREQVKGIMVLSESYFDIYTQEEQKPEGAYATEEAIGLLRSAKHSLTFIALSPNLGYAACIKSENGALIGQFREALCGALQKLGRQQEQGDETNVRMAYLNESDIKQLYTLKAAALRGLPGLAAEDGERAYLQHSAGLQEEVEEIFKTYGSARFTLKRFRPCVGGVDRLAIRDAKCFPPLGVLIVDEKEAILLWHCALLTSEPKVAAYIAGDVDEVKFITTFCESYEHLYAKD